jgi:cyclopropane-fatty-acyl-phospholipid synthase
MSTATTGTAMTNTATFVAGPTIVPRGEAVSLARPLTLLESLGRRLVLRALAGLRFGRVTIVDGGVRHESPATADAASAPACVVRVLDRRFYSAAAFGGTIGIAEAFMDGVWETDDLPGLIETLTVNYEAMMGLEVALSTVRAPVEWARMLMRRNTLAGSRRNIRAHYDLSNEFFGMFLDPTMTYSCGIFERGTETLEAAQVEKIDRACRKLRLTASDHLLEIGTGWGALALHAAKRYGCRVTTTTISDRQHEMAERRIREQGLGDRITLLKEDYRNLTGTYDKLVSIEMVEAVGEENIDGYFRKCSGLLRPEGAALIQAIVIRDRFFRSAARSNDFLKEYIFPGSCLLSVQRIVDAVMRKTDLRMWHMEDIGPHYARTLALWREAFHARLADVRALGYDERFVRMWEYYLAYCEGAFRARHVGDVQVLLTKPMWREDER